MKFMLLLLTIISFKFAKASMNENIVICSLEKKQLLTFMQDGKYHPDSLDIEGFIHCCKPSQLKYVADKFFSKDEYVLLISSKELLGKDLLYEGKDLFPHLYRELYPNDLSDIQFIERGINGQFDLRQWSK